MSVIGAYPVACERDHPHLPAAEPTSDLGRHKDLSPGLPAGPEALSAILRGLLVHNFTANVQGLRFPTERMAHMQTVGAEAILDNVFSLDPAPVGLKRPAERRMVGFCYHFALLHCALLRATGLINDVAALNKVEVSGWYWCDRINVEPLDQPHDELDTSLDILSRLAATAESVETIKECFDLYPELQPPADAVAR